MFQSNVAMKLVLALAGAALVTLFVSEISGTRREPAAGAAASPARAPSPETPSSNSADWNGTLAELRGQNLRLEQRSDEIARVLAALGERLAEIERHEPTDRRAAGSRDAEDPPPELDPAQVERAEAEERERAEEQLRGQLQLLEDALLLEETDAAWSKAAERDIAEGVGSVSDQGLWLERAECRGTYCRIEVAVDPAAPGDEAVHAFQKIAPWGGETFFRFKAGENGGAVLYVAREGHRLPRLEEAVR